jgi:predicted HTH transcriptional regulator
MINKGLSDITENDLLSLINEGVSEGRNIDYKRDLPKGNDEGKKEFLADVSSFANTAGGDLIFGIEEEQGLPTNVIGIHVVDMDLEVRRLDSILASGISPRIKYEMRAIPLQSGNVVLMVRTQRSWLGPHRIVFKGHDKFYGRNSAGKYPLDVTELRTAFNLSGTVNERIRAFRTDRIIALMNNETPIPFTDTPKVILHLIPLAWIIHEIRGQKA